MTPAHECAGVQRTVPRRVASSTESARPRPPSGTRSRLFLPVRRLFTINGRLLHSVQDLQDKHFYVAAGLEAFKSLPYLESPGAAAAAPQ